MSKRVSRMIACVGFAFGMLAVLLWGDGRQTVAQPKAPVITPAPQAPTLTTLASLGAKPGAEVELTLTGTNLADPIAVFLSCPAKVTIPTDNKNGTEATRFRVKVSVDATAAPGLYAIRVATKHGVSNARPFVVDSFTTVASTGTNRTKETALGVDAPCVVTGVVAAETSEFYRVKVQAGQKLTFEVLARRIGSPLDPIIVLHDAKTKRELLDLYADDTTGLQGDCRLTHTFKEAGEVLIEVRDTTYRGGADFSYRLRIGDFPGVTTAFPLAVERGKPASIGFAGPEIVPAVSVTAPRTKDWPHLPLLPAVMAGRFPVLLTDHPQIIEQEPNDNPAKANKLPVPGGASGRFDKAKDIDCFSVTAKKGQKLAVTVLTYEVRSPAEVLVRVLDAKGTEVARSNPTASTNYFEFTPATDGDYVIACEHLNFLYGPNEVYYLSVAPVGPDFTVVLGFDRGEAPAGGGTAMMVTVTRLNGYAGPVELSIEGHPALSGKITLSAGQTITFVPLLVQAGTKPGVYAFRVKATATVDGITVTRYGQFVDLLKANFAGMPNPPLEMVNQCVLGVIDTAPLTVQLTPDPVSLERGKSAKIVIEAKRDKTADSDIGIAPLFNPPTVVPAVKPVPKGQTKGEIGVTIQPVSPPGPTPLVFRATTKVGGKDYALILPPVVFDVIDTKKVDPKQEPKKDKK